MVEGLRAATGGAAGVAWFMGGLYVGCERTATMLMHTHEARLDALRKEQARQGLDGFVIPISDEHLSEYVGGYAQRLAWLTGFGGSAGTAAVLRNPKQGLGAAMFVDGRYTLQVRDQVDGRLYEYKSVPQDKIGDWLAENAGEGARIGFDPWLHTAGWAKSVRTALADVGAELVPVAGNPLDAAVISALDSVAWLLNIRGADVERTPVALSYVIAHTDGTADWFIAPGKVPAEVAAHLGNAVRVRPRDQFTAALAELKDKRVAADPDRSVAAIFSALEAAGAEAVRLTDPVVLPKAIKNAAEQAGHRAAQARDGAAVARFLHWLSVEAPKGEVDELAAAARLQQFRKDTGDLRDLSFDTISGAGPNGAIVHYRVSEETNRRLEPGSVFLVDSGGQYADGTTDITRTVWIGPGTPPAEVKDRFTRVLQGYIALP